jgi:DNA ligase 1
MNSQIVEFPTLYGIDKLNKIKEWNIKVENKGQFSIITYSYGYSNGRKIECSLNVTNGKNIGKRNQTTHFQQAVLDAKSKWNKKKDIDKYTTELSNLNNTNTNNTNHCVTSSQTNINNNTTFLPMLAQDFSKHHKKLKFPCYIQPKLDGYRMIYNPFTNQLTSRTGKPYTILENTPLHHALQNLNSKFPIDGELYVHDPHFNFEKYGILRKQCKSKISPAELNILNSIQYHIYDIIDQNSEFYKRSDYISTFTSNNLIQIVPTNLCSNENDIQHYHSLYTNDNYEGSIVRNKNGMYKQKYRSYDLLKKKDFDDSEFEIIDFTCENDFTGSNDKPIVWICKNKNGSTFNVPSKGTRSERTELYLNGNKYIGKMLWVQFFGYTQDGIPRFPKTMRNGKLSIRELIE